MLCRGSVAIPGWQYIQSWVDENAYDGVVGDNGSQTPVHGVNDQGVGNIGQTSGCESPDTDVHLGGMGKCVSLAGLTTSELIDKSGEGNRSTAQHLGNGGDDDGSTVDVDGVRVHSTGDEYDNEGAGNVGETAASGPGSVGRTLLAGVATTRQINDWSGSRDVIGLATQGGGVTVHSPGGRVDDGAGNVDGSRINGLPEDVVGRNPPVGPVITDETNGQAGSTDVVELTVQGDAVSPSKDPSAIVGHPEDVLRPNSPVARANVEPVVSVMGFTGIDEGNGDAGQHGQPRCPGVSNDMIPVLGVHVHPVQSDADRCGEATTPGSGPTTTTDPGQNAVHLVREVAWSTRAGQRARPTLMGLMFQYPVQWDMISIDGQRQRARATEGSVI